MDQRLIDFGNKLFSLGVLEYTLTDQEEAEIEQAATNMDDCPVRNGNRTLDQIRACCYRGMTAEYAIANMVDGIEKMHPDGGNIDPGDHRTYAVDLVYQGDLKLQVKSFGLDDNWTYSGKTFASIYKNMQYYAGIVVCGTYPLGLPRDKWETREWLVKPKLIVPTENFMKYHQRTIQPGRSGYFWAHHWGAVSNGDCLVNYDIGGIRREQQRSA
jgi:hypothetical protein